MAKGKDWYKHYPNNKFGEFVQLLLRTKNTDFTTVATLLKTNRLILTCATTARLNPIPSVWEDRLVESFALSDAEARVLNKFIKLSNAAVKTKRSAMP